MNDKLETELRSAIRTQAESVYPTDRLGAIRARTRGESAPVRATWWNRPWVLAAGTGLVAASVITAAVVLADPSSDEPPVVASTQREVTVYELGGVGKQGWLYPVSVTTEDTGDPAVDAVRALLAHEPTGNHFTLWADLCTHGNGVRLDADVGDADCDLDPQGYEAQQQLAWTVKDASESTGAEEVVIDGAVLRPVAADPAALSPIIIESPTDASTVSSPVTISGTSDTFEATVVWQVVSEDTSFTEAGSTMGGTMGERAPFEFTIDLQPGTYTARAYAEDMETGGLFAEDTVTFTVE